MAAGDDPLTVLQRVLVLERQQGFQDRAAVGGLERFARFQLDRADDHARSRLRPAVGLIAGYAQTDRRGRESAVSAALSALLTGVTQRSVPDPSASTAGDASVDPVPGGERGGGRSHASDKASPDVSAPAPARERPRLTVVHGPEELENPVSGFKGMRKATAEALARAGVVTVRDLITYYPRTHYDYADTRSISRMRMGAKTTLVGTIEQVRNNRTRGRVVITTATVSDDTGTVAVRWFNQPYLAEKLPVGARVAISGEPDVFNGYTVFQPRDWELLDDPHTTHTGRLVPIYPLTRGLYQRSLRQLVRRTVEEYRSAIVDYLPDDLREGLRLPALPDAVAQYHFPDDEEDRALAEQRLAFDELLLVQLGLLMRKQDWQRRIPGVEVGIDRELRQRFEVSLPFTLTGAQHAVIDEILGDVARPVPMSRLLQGDVGSGKTVVAAAVLLQVIAAGKQGILMAPTEILAEQHFRTLSQLLTPFSVECRLLTGSTPRPERKRVYLEAATGQAQLIVGTHALIQEGLEVADLGLAITDEQHRFGVEQRAALREKGLHPHILAMTATPIPRTLAMTIYGDLDVSLIDEMPPGRLAPITTWSRNPAEAYGVVRDEIRKGRQAFVICPVIEESAESDMRSVIAEHRELAELRFPDLEVGLLHGRMRAAEKERVLGAFRAGECHVLVATSVVEVGIDVPNATVMVIRDAHRFGLAQLHQFRGRVGRGGDQAYCVLLSATEGDDARDRLEALTATENGFELAEEDLRLRGPGEFWGTRQSGLPTLKVAQLGDLPTIQLARQAAQQLLAADSMLAASENTALREQVQRFWSERADLS